MSTQTNPRTDASAVGSILTLVVVLLVVVAVGLTISYGAHVLHDMIDGMFTAPTGTTGSVQ